MSQVDPNKSQPKDCEHSGFGASDLGLGGDLVTWWWICFFLFGKLIFSPKMICEERLVQKLLGCNN